MIGSVSGRLTVLKVLPATRRKGRLLCACACGAEKVIRKDHFLSEETTSCGCVQKERASQSNSTHGMSNSHEFAIWSGMIQRCTNPLNKAFKNYGGRGINVCDRWKSSYENFFSDMGRRPGPNYSIERVDNDRGYEPSNCIWATASQQAKNRRNGSARGEQAKHSKLTEGAVLEIRCSDLTNAELGRKFGVTRSAIYNVRNGLSWAHQKADALELNKEIDRLTKVDGGAA